MGSLCAVQIVTQLRSSDVHGHLVLFCSSWSSSAHLLVRRLRWLQRQLLDKKGTLPLLCPMILHSYTWPIRCVSMPRQTAPSTLVIRRPYTSWPYTGGNSYNIDTQSNIRIWPDRRNYHVIKLPVAIRGRGFKRSLAHAPTFKGLARSHARCCADGEPGGSFCMARIAVPTARCSRITVTPGPARVRLRIWLFGDWQTDLDEPNRQIGYVATAVANGVTAIFFRK